MKIVGDRFEKFFNINILFFYFEPLHEALLRYVFLNFFFLYCRRRNYLDPTKRKLEKTFC